MHIATAQDKEAQEEKHDSLNRQYKIHSCKQIRQILLSPINHHVQYISGHTPSTGRITTV